MCMSSYCPVCNGMETIREACPSCMEALTDCGRIDDYTGPYAPYRNIDELKLTNGYDDLGSYSCVHLLYCSKCRSSSTLSVSEWPSYS